MGSWASEILGPPARLRTPTNRSSPAFPRPRTTHDGAPSPFPETTTLSGRLPTALPLSWIDHECAAKCGVRPDLGHGSGHCFAYGESVRQEVPKQMLGCLIRMSR